MNLVKDTTSPETPRAQANGNAEHYDDVGGDVSGDADRETGAWWER